VTFTWPADTIHTRYSTAFLDITHLFLNQSTIQCHLPIYSNLFLLRVYFAQWSTFSSTSWITSQKATMWLAHKTVYKSLVFCNILHQLLYTIYWHCHQNWLNATNDWMLNRNVADGSGRYKKTRLLSRLLSGGTGDNQVRLHEVFSKQAYFGVQGRKLSPPIKKSPFTPIKLYCKNTRSYNNYNINISTE
jgi:hypothetical protein